MGVMAFIDRFTSESIFGHDDFWHSGTNILVLNIKVQTSAPQISTHSERSNLSHDRVYFAHKPLQGHGHITQQTPEPGRGCMGTCEIVTTQLTYDSNA